MEYSSPSIVPWRTNPVYGIDTLFCLSIIVIRSGMLVKGNCTYNCSIYHLPIKEDCVMKMAFEILRLPATADQATIIPKVDVDETFSI